MQQSPEAPAGTMTGSLALIGVATLLRKVVDQSLAEAGLSIRHLSVLGHVRARPGVSITELARRVNITAQSMHTTVHDLIDTGALTTDAPLRRGRSGAVRITESGAERLAEGLRIVARIDARFGLDRLDTEALMHIAMDVLSATDSVPTR